MILDLFSSFYGISVSEICQPQEINEGQTARACPSPFCTPGLFPGRDSQRGRVQIGTPRTYHNPRGCWLDSARGASSAASPRPIWGSGGSGGAEEAGEERDA